MKGSIQYRADRGVFYVSWWHKGKAFKIYRYNGQILETKRMAQKLLSVMQADAESGFFRIEKYTGPHWTDTIPYLHHWLGSVEDILSPATMQGYRNSVTKHLVPYFQRTGIQLHQIQYDVLCDLIKAVPGSGSNKIRVVTALRACLSHAHKSGHIQAMPRFPERRMYRMAPPDPQWITEDRQIAIIEAIPEKHRAIFWWLKYHLRRPAEACALKKEDWIEDEKCWIVRRGVSAGKFVERTKTGEIHMVPCHRDFLPMVASCLRSFGAYFFVNADGQRRGRPYLPDSLTDIWARAAKSVGESVTLYAGTKHSSCGQLVNQKGLSLSELQMLTDHKSMAAVSHYAKATLARRREIMDRADNVVDFPETSPRRSQTHE